jgi:hypothetical protein
MPSTTLEYICTKRRYESRAKRSSPLSDGQRGGGLVVEPQVEDGVHHPRHRHRGPGAHRHQQRPPAPAERLSGGLLQPVQRRVHLGGERVGVAPVRMKWRQHSVVMVKPGGTGTPMRAISASPAPLPPSSSFISPLPSVWSAP